MYHKTTLENGLRIITSPMPHTRSVSICIYLGVGARYEPDEVAGASHFIEHVLFRGTEKRPLSKDISGAIEGVGGILNGGTDKELTVYWCKVAQLHFEMALDVLTDMILHSKFEKNDFEKERKVIVEEIGMSNDSPQQKVGILIDEILWPEHPLGRDVAGSKDTVRKMTLNQVLKYMDCEYSPKNTVISIAGNVKHEQACAAVVKFLGDWKSKDTCLQYVPFVEKENPRLIVERRETEQTHLCLALRGVSLRDPKRFTLDLMNVILGEGMSSRLFLEVRDKLGLVYNIHSYLDHFQESGALTVYAGIDPKNLTDGIQAITKELHLLKTEVPPEELTKAKELSKGRLLLRMEDSRSVAGWTGGQEILNGGILSVEQVVAIIDKITVKDITDIAEEFLIDKHLRLSVVGPVKETRDELLGLLKI